MSNLREKFERALESDDKGLAGSFAVIVDGISDDGHALARSIAEAPEVDGWVIIENQDRLVSGEFVNVKITAADEHDLWADLV